MNPAPADAALDEVLEAYLLTAAGPDHAALQPWVARYPQYAAELTACAVEWSQLAWLPPGAPLEGTRLDDAVAQGMRVVGQLLDAAPAPVPAPAPSPLAPVPVAPSLAPAWWRRRIVIPLPAFAGGIAVLAILVLGLTFWLARPWTMAAQPAPLVSYGGTIHAMTATGWVVDDEEILVDSQTAIHGEPVVGGAVVCIGELRPPSFQLHAVAVWVQAATPAEAPPGPHN